MFPPLQSLLQTGYHYFPTALRLSFFGSSELGKQWQHTVLPDGGVSGSS